MDGVTTRLQAAKRDALLSQKPAASRANNGNSSQNLSTVSTSSTTSSSRARAAARKAKLQIEEEALKQKELLEREELLMRQKREEEEKMLKQKREEEEKMLKQKREEEEKMLKLKREEEEKNFHYQSQLKELDLMQRKRMLQLQIDLEAAAAEEAAYDNAIELNLEPKCSHVNVEQSIKSEVVRASLKQCPPKMNYEYHKMAPSKNDEAPEVSRAKQTIFATPTLPSQTEMLKLPVSRPMPASFYQNSLQEKLLQGMATIKLPSTEVPVFSGEPIRYCKFIIAFETLIESKEQDARQCLYYLAQFTRGMPHDLVSSCMYMSNAEEAFQRAKWLLKENYGQPYQITSAFIDKLSN